MVRVKKEFLGKKVGFNGSAKPLGERDDLDILARIAINSNDPSLLNLFETIPNEEQLREDAGSSFLSQTNDNQQDEDDEA